MWPIKWPSSCTTSSSITWYLVHATGIWELPGLNPVKKVWIQNVFHCSMFIFTLYMFLLLLRTFNAGTKEATSRMTNSRGSDRTSLKHEANRSSLYCCILIRTWKKERPKLHCKFALLWVSLCLHVSRISLWSIVYDIFSDGNQVTSVFCAWSRPKKENKNIQQRTLPGFITIPLY